MSTTAAANSPTPATTPPGEHRPVSPVEYVRSLSPEDKEDVLIALLREVIAFNGGKGLIPIETPEGEWLGYYVPPEAAAARAEALLPKLTPEREAELARRRAEPGKMISEEEFRAWVRQADPAENP